MNIYPAIEGIAAAVEALRNGEIVCYPTETFYALGIDLRNSSARQRLFSTKRRSAEKDLPLIASDMQMVSKFSDTSDPRLHALTKKFWPGPLTVVLRSLGGKGSLAIRISSHPIARELARSFGSPIVSTSANVSGEPAIAEPSLLNHEVQRYIAVLLDDGRCAGGKPSTIVSLLEKPAKILREGEISGAEILSLL